MLMMHILQEHGKQAAEEASGAAQNASEPAVNAVNAAGHAVSVPEAAGHAAGHGEHIPFIVEKVNEWIGEPIFNLQALIMPKIYQTLKIFGPQWPGEGKSFHEYMAEGHLPI